jgi:hypothetical protein
MKTPKKILRSRLRQKAAMAKGEVAAPVAGLTLQRAAEYDEGIFDVTNRLQSMVPSL